MKLVVLVLDGSNASGEITAFSELVDRLLKLGRTMILNLSCLRQSLRNDAWDEYASQRTFVIDSKDDLGVLPSCDSDHYARWLVPVYCHLVLSEKVEQANRCHWRVIGQLQLLRCLNDEVGDNQRRPSLDGIVEHKEIWP